MFCPNCGSKFKNIVVKSHYGINIELEQCLSCGGIWCDDLEIYRISPESTQGIDKLDIKKLKEFTPIKQELVCPKCKIVLQEFKNPYFPKQIKIEHCFKCGGFWLNRGELTQFKEWQQQQKIKKKLSLKELKIKDKELSKELNGLLAMAELSDLERKKTFEAWAEAGKFLAQKAHPYTIVARTGIKSEEAAKIVAYIYIILQILSQIAIRLITK